MIFQNNRGIALILSIAVCSLLFTTALSLNRKVRFSIIASASSKDRLILSQMAWSGVNAAIALLVRDRYETDDIDSVQEDWANTEKINELLADILYEDGTIELKITDELSKIQVNAIVDKFPSGSRFNYPQKDMWEKFIKFLISKDDRLSDLVPETITSSIKDWLDSNDDDAITGVNGAESDYYQGLDPPYSCRNEPVKNLDELVLIKGITSELYYGIMKGYSVSRCLTIYGAERVANSDNLIKFNGKININTADIPVLIALLPEGSEELAKDIYDYRIETSDSKFVNDIKRKKWYRHVSGSSIILTPKRVKRFEKLIRYGSDLFRIDTDVELHGIKMSMSAVVKREKDKATQKWICRILSNNMS